MKDIFETSVWELSTYLTLTLPSVKPGDMFRVLDWTDRLDDDDGYDNLCYDISDFGKCSVDTFAADHPADEGEQLTFHTIRANGVGKGCYDLVVLRRLTGYDNGVDDVIKRSAEALKDGGVLYANLVVTSELEHLFKAAEKFGLCPAAASKIIIDDTRTDCESRLDIFKDDFLALYDMQGYIQLAFKKGACGRFRYTEAVVTEGNLCPDGEEANLYELKSAAFDGIWCALTGDKMGVFAQDCDPEGGILAEYRTWIRSTLETDVSQVGDLFQKMKEDGASWSYPWDSQNEKIRFSDYFEVDTPHHTKLSELDTAKHYYLSPSNPVHCLIDNLINADQPSLPEDVLRRVNLNNMGNIFDLIDEKGKVIPASTTWFVGMGSNSRAIRRCDYCESPPVELHALNNIAGAGIDISATLLYNLIRITPKGKRITPEYLKLFFFVDNCTGQMVLNFSNMQPLPGDFEVTSDDAQFQGGRYAIHDFSEYHSCQSVQAQETAFDEDNACYDTDFGTYSADSVRRAYIYVDNIKEHGKLAEDFLLDRDQYRARANVRKRFADIAFMNDLRGREIKVRNIRGQKRVWDGTSTEKQLLLGETDYRIALKENRKEVSLLHYLIALEVFLKLCFDCCNDRESLDCGDCPVNLTLGSLYHIYQNRCNIQYLLKKDADKGKYHLMLSRLQKYRKLRNEAAHSGAMVRLDSAEVIINEICDTLKIIAEIAVD